MSNGILLNVTGIAAAARDDSRADDDDPLVCRNYPLEEPYIGSIRTYLTNEHSKMGSSEDSTLMETSKLFFPFFGDTFFLAPGSGLYPSRRTVVSW